MLETALLQPDGDAWLDAVPEPLVHSTGGEVRIVMFGLGTPGLLFDVAVEGTEHAVAAVVLDHALGDALSLKSRIILQASSADWSRTLL